MEDLNIDEIMALLMFGMPTTQIERTTLPKFDKLFDEHPEFDGYLEKANSILDRQEELGIVSVTCQEHDFPRPLLDTDDDCPPVIHCKGNLDLITERKAVAIIGARAADKEGNAKAYELGTKYAREGYVVVSGLALGCDASAHRGCLSVGGKTIAIVGNGLDITHPRENKSLEDEILANGGLIMSEQPVGVKANPTRLVARNRLQAAMSQIVILAQCPEHSGSMHTMRFARKYRKQCLAATFPRRTEANAGNYFLIDQNLAKPI